MFKIRPKIIVLGIIIAIIITACGILSGPPTPTFIPPTLFPTSPPEPTAVLIQHLTKPTAGTEQVANAHDNEESNISDEKNAPHGDDFRINRFERPFTTEEMVYLPQIDIMGMSMSKDDDWYYVQIKLSAVDQTTLDMSGIYGVEFDMDIDGKTEILLLAHPPFSSDWSTDGVVIYLDENADIGGMGSYPDDIYTGNGYETIIFDSGVGDDPDAAWSRAFSDRAIVEIAFKQEYLRDFPKWMWNVLASANPLDPTKMYFNDTFTRERAGSPQRGNEHYPLKELAGFDNTCRVPANFQADGSEPMGCAVKIEEQEDIGFESSGGYP